MLAIDLEYEQVIVFNEKGSAQNLLDSGPPATTLTAFFEAMSLHPHMRHIVYHKNIIKKHLIIKNK